MPCGDACQCSECENPGAVAGERAAGGGGAPAKRPRAPGARSGQRRPKAQRVPDDDYGAFDSYGGYTGGDDPAPALAGLAGLAAAAASPPPHPSTADLVEAAIGDGGVGELVTSLVAVLTAHAAGSGAGAAAAAAVGLPPPPGAAPPPVASAEVMAAEAAVLEAFAGAMRSMVAGVVGGGVVGGGGLGLGAGAPPPPAPPAPPPPPAPLEATATAAPPPPPPKAEPD